MFRTLLSFLLLLAVAAETSAQTTPAGATTTTATKTTARTRTTTRRPVKKARRTMVRKTTTRRVGATSAPARPAVAERTAIGPGGNGAVGSSATADSKGENVYAAPGMPVNVQTGKVESYNGRPAGERAPAKGNSTLTPAASPK